MNPYLYIFGEEFPWYGLLFGFGMVFGGFLSALRSKKRTVPRFDCIAASCFGMMGGMVGAKLLALLPIYDEIILLIALRKFTMEMFVEIMQTGFVFYGGLIGGALGIILYCKIYKINYLDLLDVSAVSVPLGHVFGRIGCFLSGCCYGMPYDGILSFQYSHVHYPIMGAQTPVGVSLFPVQLVEAFSLLILWIVLESLFHKYNKRGLTTCVYAYSYAVIRFILEYFRYDSIRGVYFGLSTSQIISILIVLVVSIVLITNIVKNKKKKQKELLN